MSSEVFWTMPMLSVRWRRCGRTIARWREQGLIPEPDIYLGKQPAWTEETVLAVEAEMKRRAVESPPVYPNMAKAQAGLAARRTKLAAEGLKEKRAPRGAKAGKTHFADYLLSLETMNAVEALSNAGKAFGKARWGA